ncbi:UNVERIFIED_CONTAM: 40S ribosomal protein S12 [Sesamum latifolium]|uniref:40S ribosomal protein S12 n=1 Tax=Sesamum latifolium TaxID=2727402 RepID=A0AAW2XKX5_9LAMI
MHFSAAKVEIGDRSEAPRLTSGRKMSGEDAPVAEAPAPALGEPMDIMTALQLVLRKSRAHGGLARGLHEAAKVIEKHAAQLCVLAEDCDQADYVKLVKALCADHNVSLITVPSAKTWRVGWSKFLALHFLTLSLSFGNPIFSEIWDDV